MAISFWHFYSKKSSPSAWVCSQSNVSFAGKKAVLPQLRLMPPCVLSPWHTSPYFTSVLNDCPPTEEKKQYEREKSTVSDHTAKDFAHWFIGEMKVSPPLSLPGPVLVWTMWKHQWEGRRVSWDPRVCICKFHLILKMHFRVRSLFVLVWFGFFQVLFCLFFSWAYKTVLI